MRDRMYLLGRRLQARPEGAGERAAVEGAAGEGAAGELLFRVMGRPGESVEVTLVSPARVVLIQSVTIGAEGTSILRVPGTDQN